MLEVVSTLMKDARYVYCSAIRSNLLPWVDVSLLSGLLLDSLEPTLSPPPILVLFCKSQGSLQSHKSQR